MSSILKALRKIEEEKRVASHAAPDLRMDQGGTAVKSRPMLLLVAGAILGAVFVSLFLLWPSSEVAERVAQTSSRPLQAPSATLEKPLLPATESEPVTVKPEPVAVKSEPVTVKPEPVTVKPEPVRVKSEPVRVKSEPAPAQSDTIPANVLSLPQGISLEVTEIYFQNDGTNSMAVVNDLPVMVGSYVESAVVTEILSDSVIFKIGDEAYDVPVMPLQ